MYVANRDTYIDLIAVLRTTVYYVSEIWNVLRTTVYYVSEIWNVCTVQVKIIHIMFNTSVIIGAAVGGVVGGALLLVAVLGFISFLIMKSRHSKTWHR